MNTYLGVKGTDGKVLRDVTDSSGLPVSLTGSNVATEYLNNITITAGSSSAIGVQSFVFSRIGVAARLVASRKFKIVATPQSSGGSAFDASITLLDKSATAADRGTASYQLQTKRYDIAVVNSDTVDLTVTVLSVTQFNS